MLYSLLFVVSLSLHPVQDARRSLAALDELAGGEGGPQLAEEAPVVAVVQVSEQRLDGIAGLLCLVEGDAAVQGLAGKLGRVWGRLRTRRGGE